VAVAEELMEALATLTSDSVEVAVEHQGLLLLTLDQWVQLPVGVLNLAEVVAAHGVDTA